MKAKFINESSSPDPDLNFTRGQDSKKPLGIGIFRDIAKLKSLKLPVKYEYGSIVDNDDKIIINANRDTTSTLLPWERDDLLKLIVTFINWSYGSSGS